ncbi:preprotein translocase subunit YajC [uncultured Eubacterium sp.]|uniref:preprotein translocase subunit YajC n=1 Tax=uncultured Eubacterium sp. TaxID=165185 RepID=UPI0025EA7A9C|nr:preprotein translocase subunit YajC [uncultured Eubacterium sp.]MCI6536385.1 preprotein translocase subunit YajC [Lachnospiraceae bacterium]
MNVLSSGAGMGMMGTIIWIVVLLVFVFIFMLRPQKKEQARRNEMMSKMAVGDTVLTSSGFYGTLIDINDDTVIVEFGNNKNCRIPMQRAAIAQIEKAEDAVEE